jgi:hypothetical protein
MGWSLEPSFFRYAAPRARSKKGRNLKMDRQQALISFYDSFSALAQFMWNHREETPEIHALCQRAVDSGKNCLYAQVSELLNLRNYPLPGPSPLFAMRSLIQKAYLFSLMQSEMFM